MNASEIIPVAVSKLHFDFKNPRLVEFKLDENSTEPDIIKILWESMDVRELVMSIAAAGYLSHEPLVITEEDAKYVVIEGNRRLAAVKLLLNPTSDLYRNFKIPEITEEARESLQHLPAILSTRRGAWQYLGFKHVNGPAKWTSYAKAKYIAEVHHSFEVSLDDIANQIGDLHRTVLRLYRGIMVIDEAEDMQVFSRDDTWNNRFFFSHMYASLERPNINRFLDLSPEYEENRRPVPPEKKNELRQLCRWLYGSRRDQVPPVVQTQNPHVRYLDAIIGNQEATAALRTGSNIKDAYQITLPASNVFEESLVHAKQDLQKAHSLLSDGYTDSEVLLRLADSVAELADDLHQRMLRKNNPAQSRRRPTEAA